MSESRHPSPRQERVSVCVQAPLTKAGEGECLCSGTPHQGKRG